VAFFPPIYARAGAREAAQKATYIAGLRKAGMPEE
jgi:hypothetical protein